MNEGLIDKAFVLEYSRFKNNKRVSADLVCVLKNITDRYVVVQTKDNSVFVIPIHKVENLRLLGKPKW